MNVFLWQSFGTDAIFETENDEAIDKLLDRIALAVADWNIDREVDYLRQTLLERPNAIRIEITKFFNRHSDHEMLEYGHFLTTTRLA